MLGYAVRRIMALIPVLFLIVFIAFSLLQMIPGDPAVIMLGTEATPEKIAIMHERLGLDKPFHVQFLTYLGKVIRGNLGQSIFLDQPVAEAILQRAPTTLLLATMAITWAILIGIPSGIIAATHRGSIIDRLVMSGALLGMCIPSFWLGLNLILIFAVWMRWFPTGGYVPITTDFFAAIRHMVLPSFSLGFIMTAQIARMTRSAMLETLAQDFIDTARAKGLSERMVVYKHALKNGMLSVITVIGLIFAVLLGQTAITEAIFTIPGIGQLILRGVSNRDYALIQGSLVMVGGAYVLVNLLIDLTYGLIDPRITYK